ncbi:MAG: hypothetical protein AB8G22_25205 [Saprospiraceae bacterium]
MLSKRVAITPLVANSYLNRLQRVAMPPLNSRGVPRCATEIKFDVNSTNGHVATRRSLIVRSGRAKLYRHLSPNQVRGRQVQVLMVKLFDGCL